MLRALVGNGVLTVRQAVSRARPAARASAAARRFRRFAESISRRGRRSSGGSSRSALRSRLAAARRFASRGCPRLRVRSRHRRGQGWRSSLLCLIGAAVVVRSFPDRLACAEWCRFSSSTTTRRSGGCSSARSRRRATTSPAPRTAARRWPRSSGRRPDLRRARRRRCPASTGSRVCRRLRGARAGRCRSCC